MKFSLLLLAPLLLFALSGKVVSVHDGDTITILAEKEQIKIRLFGIDAPELKQLFGRKSKEFLTSMIAGQDVEIEQQGNDRYGRVIGIVFLGDRDINKEMVADGYAWAFRKFSKKYAPQESEAKFEKRGLWRDNPTPPWEWRKQTCP